MVTDTKKELWIKTKIKNKKFLTWAEGDLFKDSWIGQNESIGNKALAITTELGFMAEAEFIKFKNRWSSYLSRSDQKNLSCTLTKEIHNKLIKLRGNKKLKDTLEKLIEEAFAREHESPQEKITITELNLENPEVILIDKSAEPSLIACAHQVKLNNMDRKLYLLNSQLESVYRRLHALEKLR